MANAFTAVGAGIVDCTGGSAMADDLLSISGKLNLCAKVEGAKLGISAYNRRSGLMSTPGGAKEKGAIGDFACPLLVTNLQTQLQGKIPAKYGCSNSVTVATLANYVTTKCEGWISF